MQLNRGKNAKKNIIFGLINKCVMLTFPFVIQSVVTQKLGAEYLGIRGLYTSIFQVLNLTELGFGNAIVFAMYKPIAEDDTATICALLNLYRKVYLFIGIVILLFGIAIMPFLPYLIKGGAPADVNIYIIYFLYLINAVLSYWVFAYKSSILCAFQRMDIISVVTTMTQLGMYIGQISLLYILKNYYIYVLVSIVATLLYNLLLSYQVDRTFPQYKCVGKVTNEQKELIKTKVSGLMLLKLCSTTRNSFDNIFISRFLGLTITAMYNNYYMILTGMIGIISTITSSILAGVGNSMQLDSVEKNYKNMEKIDYIYMLLCGWCTICLVCLLQPFVEIWMGKKMLFPFPVAVMFSVYFYILKMGDIRGVYSDAAGLWWENRYRTFIEAIANIILNYLLVKRWGVYGIIIATIGTLFFIGFLGSAHVLFNFYYKQGLWKFLRNHLYYALVTGINGVLTYSIARTIEGDVWRIFLGRILICVTISPLLYLLIYFRSKIFRESIKWVKNV